MTAADMTDVTLFGSSPFDAIRRTDESGEYWTGRDLALVMEYLKWENFAAVVVKARYSLSLVEGSDSAAHHFLAAGSDGGRWGNQRLDDYRLTRFGAYLTAMAGDDSKKAVAEARVYFAVKTREAEVVRPALPDITTPNGVLAMAEQFAATARQLVEVTARNAELEPKAEAHDAYMDSTGLFLIREVAKTLGLQEKKLRQFCYDHGILMSHPSRRNEPYAQHVTAGHFEVKSRPVKVSEEETRAFNTTYVTAKGLEWLRQALERKGVIERPRLSLVRPGGVA